MGRVVPFTSTWTNRGGPHVTTETTLVPKIVEAFGRDRESKRHFRIQMPMYGGNATVAAWTHVAQGLPWEFDDPLEAMRILGDTYEAWLEDHVCAPIALGALALTTKHSELDRAVLFRDVPSMAECVARGIAPIAFGFHWRQDMQTPNQQSGLVSWTGPILGGSAVAITGIDERKGLFRIMSNRGLQWGQLGRAWLSFADVTRILQGAYEAWTVIPKKGIDRRWGGHATLSEIEGSK